MMANMTAVSYLPDLMARVEVFDIKSGLCFNVPIYPEEVTTDWVSGSYKSTMSFSPVTVPDIGHWFDGSAKLRRLRYNSYMIDDVKIKKIIFSGPCTIVLWKDGTKTIAKVSEDDVFDPEKGVAVCFMKKILGHTDTNKLLRKATAQYWNELTDFSIEQMQSDYEKRVKADMVAMLKEVDLELYEQYDDADLVKVKYIRQSIQRTINKLKEGEK